MPQATFIQLSTVIKTCAWIAKHRFKKINKKEEIDFKKIIKQNLKKVKMNFIGGARWKKTSGVKSAKADSLQGQREFSPWCLPCLKISLYILNAVESTKKLSFWFLSYKYNMVEPWQRNLKHMCHGMSACVFL